MSFHQNFRAAKLKLAAAVALALPASFAAAQTTYTWNNATGGDFFDANNWTPTGVPNGAVGGDTAVFSLDSTYTVSVNVANDPNNQPYVNILHGEFTAGNVTVDLTNYSGFFTNTGGYLSDLALQVADDPTNTGQTASLTITTSDGTGYAGGQGIGVGMYANSTGTLTLDGNNSGMNYSADFFTVIGYNNEGAPEGSGTMNVINGTQFRTPQSYIDGAVHVGSGASWDNTSNDPYGGTPTLRVGVDGTASMVVDNANTDATNTTTTLKTDDLVIGVNAGSNGTLTIEGSADYSYASNTTWTGNTAEIGVMGAALMNIYVNATATANSIDIATANRDAVDTNTVDELNVQYDSTLTIAGALRVGVADIGTLNIGGTYNDGSTDGTVNCNSAIVGVDGPGIAQVYTGDSLGGGPDSLATPEPATWNITNALIIGENPDIATGNGETSTLDIEGGGLVTSGSGIIGDTNDPNNGPSEGQVTINGVLGLNTTAVSTWQIANDLTIGNYGQGIVTLDNGGALIVGGNMYLGEYSSDGGDVLSTGSLYVNQSDSGTSSYSEPTRVSATNMYLGGSATTAGGGGNVEVTGGIVTVSNSVSIYSNSFMSVDDVGMIAIGVDAAGDIPDPGLGALIVGASQAGTLTATGGLGVGYNEVAANDATIGDGAVGTVIMNGGYLQNEGSFSYQYSASLYVPGTTIVSNTAASAGSSLLLESGGSAYPETLIIGNQTGSSGTVTVTGVSSDGYIESYLEVGTSVTVGNYGVGALDIAAGAYASLENAHLAANPGSAGTLTVDGANTHIEVYNTLDTGYGGIVNVTNGGTVVIGAPYVAHVGTVEVGSSGTLSGGGIINGDVYLEAYGTVAPGESTIAPLTGIAAAFTTHIPGILTINGGYNQDAESLLDINIDGLVAGVDFDQVDVAGPASLAGTLDVTFGAGFDTPGDYLILSSTGLTGTFDTVNLSNAPAGTEIDYLGGDVYVDVPAVPEPAMMSLLALPLLGLRRRRARGN